MNKIRECACVANDALQCFRLRYLHVDYNPEYEREDEELEGHPELCMCPCHGEIQRNYDYDEES